MTALLAEIRGEIVQKEWVKTSGRRAIINLQKKLRWGRHWKVDHELGSGTKL
jgi:hypothetical protein